MWCLVGHCQSGKVSCTVARLANNSIGTSFGALTGSRPNRPWRTVCKIDGELSGPSAGPIQHVPATACVNPQHCLKARWVVRALCPTRFPHAAAIAACAERVPHRALCKRFGPNAELEAQGPIGTCCVHAHASAEHLVGTTTCAEPLLEHALSTCEGLRISWQALW